MCLALSDEACDGQTQTRELRADVHQHLVGMGVSMVASKEV
jgi:hypothetical protein